jgi:YggT family protein
MLLLAQIVHRIIQLFILVIVIQAILSYFMSPFEPIRRFIDRLVNPFLNPIRRVLPPMGGLDFSPFVLIILLYIIDSILMRIFISLSG